MSKPKVKLLLVLVSQFEAISVLDESNSIFSTEVLPVEILNDPEYEYGSHEVINTFDGQSGYMVQLLIKLNRIE